MMLTDVLKLNENFVFRMNGEEGYLMNLIDGDVYEINSTTKYILELCNGKNELSDILQILNNKCTMDKSEVTEEDITEIADYFIINNICKNVKNENMSILM